MIASDIQDQIKRTGDALQPGDIFDAEVYMDPSQASLFPGRGNGAADKINSNHLPGMLCQEDSVRTRPASQIEGAPGWMGGDEIQQLRRRDARIPGRPLEISDIKVQPPPEFIHTLILIDNMCPINRAGAYLYGKSPLNRGVPLTINLCLTIKAISLTIYGC